MVQWSLLPYGYTLSGEVIARPSISWSTDTCLICSIYFLDWSDSGRISNRSCFNQSISGQSILKDIDTATTSSLIGESLTFGDIFTSATNYPTDKYQPI